MKQKIIKYISISLLSIVGLAALLLISTELTSRPQFCSTCHYMEPYVEGWKSSSHADVTCTDCHFPPGFKSKIRGKFTAISMVANYMTGIYKKSKPWAEISDSSCLRSGCHQERLLSGLVSFKEDIIFDHKPHLTQLRRGKNLRCTSCHSQIVQGDHITVTESSCFLCHFKGQDESAKINDCTWCHDAPVSNDKVTVSYDHTFILQQDIDCKKCHGPMQVGDGSVPEERCNACHADPEILTRYDDPNFIHQNHVTDHKVECQICHLVIQHKSVARSRDIVPTCESCHENTHQGQLNLFTGTGGKGVKPHPNPMFEGGLNCQACHVFHQIGEAEVDFGDVSRANFKSCEMCHGEGYNLILEQWKTAMKEKLDLLDSLYVKATGEIMESHATDEKKSEAKSLLADAKYNYQMVKKGNIVHNVAFSDELLMASFSTIQKALNTIGSTSPLPVFTLYGSSIIPTRCVNCHYGIEDITVNVFDMKFPHELHILKNGTSCDRCHSNQRRHGELLLTEKNDCLSSCHHTPEVDDCSKCHETQKRMYNGTAFNDKVNLPDVMFEEDISCRDCHENEDAEITARVEDNCIDCHDDGYTDTLIEWQLEISEKVDKVQKFIDALQAMGTPLNNGKIDEYISELQMIRDDKSNGAHNYELINKKLVLMEQNLSRMLPSP